MITKEIKELIENNALALATISQDNSPHCIAVNSVKVINENQIIVTDNYMSETIKNIKLNPNLALVVLNNNLGYELRGKAEYFNKGKYLDFVRKIPENKGYPTKGAILVTLNKIKKLV